MTFDLDEINKKITKSDKKIFNFFQNPQISASDINSYLSDFSNKKAYMVAITPRSGSTFFCDLLEKTEALGRPNEWLNPTFMPSILQTRPSENLVQHFINMRRFTSTKNEVFGMKASFFQFTPMIDTRLDRVLMPEFKLIKLFRKNILLQAISLYIATETDIFHTNVEHGEDKLSKLDRLTHDDEKVREWIRHIYRQELGWNRYLDGKSHITIYYEDFLKDINGYIRLVANYLGQSVEMNVDPEQSIFKKLGFSRTDQLYEDFVAKNENIAFMHDMKIGVERYHKSE